MALDSAELVQYARDSAQRGEDLFALLGVDATTPKDDIHRAWRRAGLKHHPDKAGANFDPAIYESLERARDVLCDPAAREAYDGAVRAALQKKRRVEEMSADRRRFVEELERAEREAKRPRTGAGQDGGLSQAERNRIVEAGRRRLEERARLMREAEERSRQRDKEMASAATTTASNEQASTSKPPAAASEDRAPERDGSPAASKPKAAEGGKDEYDERIAELERRLKEKQERKAARKSDKRSRKSDITSISSSRLSPPAAAHTPRKPTSDAATEPGVDGEKKIPFAFRPYAASAPTSPATTSTKLGSNGSLPQFAATMARLKAAQAKREEEKRKKAEAEAAGEQAA